MTRAFSEQAVLLGSANKLVGIVAQPVSPTQLPAIVIFNTGIVHRVGHHRMFVTMSRALATAGHTVLRFDFSGIGDSDPRTDGLSPLDSCIADIKEAIDWLSIHYQASRFVLAGLCSGADHAVAYGHTDERVVGLVLMDPSIPPTRRYYFLFLALRLKQLRSWLRFFTGRSRTARLLVQQAWHIVRTGKDSVHGQQSESPPREVIERHYQQSIEKKLLMLAVFTGETTRHAYREQMLEAFPKLSFGDRLRLEFFPGSDHTFGCEADRSRLIGLILNWLEGFGEAGPLRAAKNPDDGTVLNTMLN
jgi:pimeloyl-ACP methyl ester carboxylesterase